jgi:hypothetical protein
VTGNAEKYRMAREHKEIEGIKKVKGFRGLEEYQGLSRSPKDGVIHLFDWLPIFYGNLKRR